MSATTLIVHPQDARVALVTSRADFIAAARSPEFEAVIRRRNLKKRLRRARTAQIGRLWDSMRGDDVPDGEKKPVSFVTWNTDSPARIRPSMKSAPAMGERWFPLRHEFEAMARLYRDVREGAHPIIVGVQADLTLKGHTHPWDVLNCVWGGEGTGWDSPDGEALHTDEGDLFYFKAGFRHYALKKKKRQSPHRFTTIAGCTRELY